MQNITPEKMSFCREPAADDRRGCKMVGRFHSSSLSVGGMQSTPRDENRPTVEVPPKRSIRLDSKSGGCER